MEFLDNGTKVKYLNTATGKWKSGVVHGVQKAEDPETNEVTGLLYLVDTGNDVRVDEIVSDQRTDEMNRRLGDYIKKHKKAHDKDPQGVLNKGVQEISGHTDLPESKIVVEKVRQPEQVYVLPENIKAV